MATTTLTPAARIPGPPELLPGCPDAVIDLQTDEGVALVGGQWRYSDARVEDSWRRVPDANLQRAVLDPPHRRKLGLGDVQERSGRGL